MWTKSLENSSTFRLARSVRVSLRMHGIEKRIVYVLRSDTDPSRQYVGITK